MRRLELDGDLLIARFNYTPWLKDAVKALPGARFDWNSKTWRFHVEYVADIVPALLDHDFDIAAEVIELLGEHEDGDALTASSAAAGDATEERRHSVRELNVAAARALSVAFPSPVLLVGEISGFERTRSRRHAYFELVERDAAERTVATVSAVMFEGVRRRVEAALEKAGMPVADGMRVCFRGRVALYEARGSYQFVIESVDTDWIEGEQAMRRERLLRTLREEGIAEQNLALPVPELPLRIALLTSRDSDAMHDVLSSLRQSRLPFVVDLFDVRVQGRDLEHTVTEAMSRIAAAPERWDCVLITRGGGSRVELGGWDNDAVARAVLASPLKVFVAIGHQQDRCLLDDIAHSAKTPTAAAELLVEYVEDSLRYVDDLASRVDDSVTRTCACMMDSLNALEAGLRRAAERCIDGAQHQTTHLPRLIHGAAERRLAALRLPADRAHIRLHALAATTSTRQHAQRLDSMSRRVRAAASAAQHERAAEVMSRALRLRHLSLPRVRSAAAALDLAAEKVAANDPARILKRGYVMLTDAQNRIVPGADGIAAGDELTIIFRDGRAAATIVNVQAEEDSNGR